ncbi:MAG: hypothetical protein HKL90_12150 [Elusimicrobia bacterium]|nr:hypothetical protein [Elusimicrobiota bacterium]
MSLKIFHRVFIACAFVCFAFVARWASGHNAALLRTPWAFYAACAGMALLAPYFVWTVRKL